MNQDTSVTLTITRTFAAPRARVFDGWTNPNSDIGWWGPKDFTLLFNEKDLKPGGRWRMGMVRKCEENVSGGAYRETVPPARLVMTHAWEDAEGKLEPPQTPVTITFDERNDRAERVFVQTGFKDAASRDGHRGGWNEAFDALTGGLARAAIPLAAQDQFIAEAYAMTLASRTTVRTLRSSHSPLVAVPDKLARLINEAAST